MLLAVNRNIKRGSIVSTSFDPCIDDVIKFFDDRKVKQ